WEFEPGLLDVLLNDLGADGARPPEPGALPLLSHALLETWQRRRGRMLTLSGYAAAGGVRGAIAETAETGWHDQPAPAPRAVARQIFLRLTELGEEGVSADTRRRATLAELIPGSGKAAAMGQPALIKQPATLKQPAMMDHAAAVREVLNSLADARLVTVGQEG